MYKKDRLKHFPPYLLHQQLLRTASLLPLTIYKGKGLDNMLSKNTHVYIKGTPLTKIQGFSSLSKKPKTLIASLLF